MAHSARALDVICEDGPVIAVNKRSGVISQGAPAGLSSLAEQVKAYLKKKYDKPGNVYLGIPHRLDRPVSGVSVFARNSKAAARLSDQFAKRQVRKVYRAVLDSVPDEDHGELENWIYRIPDQSRVEVHRDASRGAKRARLQYQVLDVQKGKALVEVNLLTGRMHQIRVQFASRGCPIIGDEKYGSKEKFPDPNGIALHAWQLTIQHPIRKEPMTITAPLPEIWSRFRF